MRGKDSGFTLLEMLIALALIGILFLAAIPAWQHFVQQNRSESQARQLLTALTFARSEAIKQAEKIIFCPSKDQITCSADWSDGQIILRNNEVLRVYGRLPSNEKLSWKSSLGRNDRLEFVATGFTNGQKGSFLLCSTKEHIAKRIVIEQSGRARIAEEKLSC